MILNESKHTIKYQKILFSKLDSELDFTFSKTFFIYIYIFRFCSFIPTKLTKYYLQVSDIRICIHRQGATVTHRQQGCELFIMHRIISFVILIITPGFS